MKVGRVVGIDFGTKRIGIAIADPLLLFSQPVGTYSTNEAIRVLDKIAAEEGIAQVIMGWPLEEDGTEGAATERVQQFINRLKKRWPRADFVRQDERFSSEQAKELIKLGERPSLRSTGRGRIDTAAAGIILQDYLDENSGKLQP